MAPIILGHSRLVGSVLRTRFTFDPRSGVTQDRQTTPHGAKMVAKRGSLQNVKKSGHLRFNVLGGGCLWGAAANFFGGVVEIWCSRNCNNLDYTGALNPKFLHATRYLLASRLSLPLSPQSIAKSQTDPGETFRIFVCGLILTIRWAVFAA